MKSKIFLILIVLFGTIFSLGCLGNVESNASNDVYLNDVSEHMGKDLAELPVIDIRSTPTGKLFLLGQQGTGGPLPTWCMPYFSPAERVEMADVIIYGHIKEIKPAIWDTSDGKAPENYMTLVEWTDESGKMHSRYDATPTGYTLYTQVVFEVERCVKGNESVEEVTVCLFGGETDDAVIFYSESGPAPWDFQNVTIYLLFLTDTSPRFNDGGYQIKEDNHYFVSYMGSYRLNDRL